MKKNKGIIQQIKENNNPSNDKPNFNSEKFREDIQKIFETQFENASKPRELWVFEKGLKQFHKTLGDDGFYHMIMTRPITTNTKGVEYIEKFEEEYDQN